MTKGVQYNMKNDPPIIIIGMSASGIENVSSILESLGVFMGSSKNRDNEAILFHDINTWILRQFSSGRENPFPLIKKLDDREIRQKYVSYIKNNLESFHMISFLGWLKYFFYHYPTKLKSPWGWNDSINIITLPIWLDVFPDAKIIHCYRHPMDIIDMLMSKRAKSISKLKSSSQKWYKYLYWYYLATKYIPNKVLVEMRCSSPEEALSLWEEYMTITRSYSECLNSNSFMEIRYEDLLNNSEQTIREIANFCNLEFQKGDMKKATNVVKDEHLNKYLDNYQLKDFAAKPEVAELIESYYL